MTDHGLEVLVPGPSMLVQDLGRRGYAAIGVTRSGAADRAAYRLGARLLAQDPSAAALEITLGGCRIRVRGELTVALTGAPAPAEADGRPLDSGAPVALHDGQVLTLGTPPAGLRSYLSVRGGIAVPAVLDSRATDTLSGIGPRPVQAGDLLPVGPPPAGFPNVDHAPGPPLTRDALRVHAGPGPRADWLADPKQLFATAWTLSERSDRIGLRLTGPPLERHPDRTGAELPSEGVVRGAVQVPPGGSPVIFGPDHPVTGGYPVVAVIIDDDIDRLAQAVPGQGVWILPRRGFRL